jgi:hypothetical protein
LPPLPFESGGNSIQQSKSEISERRELAEPQGLLRRHDHHLDHLPEQRRPERLALDAL